MFVGLEMRNNTSVARAQTRREIAAQNVEMIMRVVEDEDLIRLYSEPWTMEFYEGLSGVDQTRLTYSAIGLVLRLEGTYLQFKEGLLDEADLLPYGFRQPHTREPWFRDSVWPGQRPALDPDFVQYFESINGY